MMHADTRLLWIDDRVGHGVFARRRIPRGTVIWMHDQLDHVFSAPEVAALPPALRAQVERLAHVDTDGRLVLCWDHARYMNHACEPATTSIGTLLEIARRDLEPGEQVTCEYGFAHVSVPFDCTCGAPTCRGSLIPPDVGELWRRWDREAAAAMAWARDVPQPVLEAAAAGGHGGWIIAALRDGRSVTLPSWAEQAPAAAWR